VLILEKDMRFHRPLLLLLAPAVLAIAACATGSAIVTGATKTPVAPEQVRIYLEPPPAFEVLGLVNASSDAGWTEQGSVNYAIEELKKQAGKLGANGVLLTSSGERSDTIVGGQDTSLVYGIPIVTKTVQGRAVFVTSP
jgi:hypothetical protein